MKKKIIIGALIILIIGLLIISNLSTESGKNVENLNENIEEIQPEEEINSEEENLAEINLYFVDSQSGILVKSTQKIESKKLLDNPYKNVLELLFKGPDDEKLVNSIPNDTKINKVELKNGILTIDLSEQFLNANGMNSINSIVNTMTEFNEIEGVKFLINGESKDGLKDVFVRK